MVERKASDFQVKENDFQELKCATVEIKVIGFQVNENDFSRNGFRSRGKESKKF